VRVTYDEEVDAAYIYLTEGGLQPFKTVPVDGILPWMINLDFDADGRLYGIEVIDARKLLPADFLERFANRNANPS
jgi:uncharacterized protein YuzE